MRTLGSFCKFDRDKTVTSNPALTTSCQRPNPSGAHVAECSSVGDNLTELVVDLLAYVPASDQGDFGNGGSEKAWHFAENVTSN